MVFQQKLLDASNSGAGWNKNTPKIEFTIDPSIGIVDLSQSSIVLNVVITNGTTGTDLGLYDVQFNNEYDARCLADSISISSNKTGLIEEVQNSNVLSQNFLRYNKSTELRNSESWLGQGKPINDFGPFLTKYVSGTTYSLQKCALQLPLRDLLGVGSVSRYFNKDGLTLQLNLEYYPDIVKGLFQECSVNFNLEDDGIAGPSSTVVYSGINQTSCLYYVGQNVGITYLPTYVGNTITAVTQANPCVMTLTGTPSSLYMVVGTVITVSGFTNNWAPANGDQIITAFDDGAKTITIGALNSTAFGGITGANYSAIVKAGTTQETDCVIVGIANGADNKRTFTLNTPWKINFASTEVKIKGLFSGVNDTDLSYRVETAQLNVVQFLPSPKQLQIMPKNMVLDYYTWEVERINMVVITANSSFVKLIDLLPNCNQVVILMPVPSSEYALTSVQDNMASYRFSLNSKYTTDRSIVPFNSMYYDKLITCFANSNNNPKYNNLQSLNAIHETNTDSMLLCQSVPVNGKSNQLQFQFVQGGANTTEAKIIYVFQCIAKELNM